MGPMPAQQDTEGNGVDEKFLEVEKASDLRISSSNPLVEINLGSEENKRSVYVNMLLDADMKKPIVQLLAKFKNYFVWTYDEMPGLRWGTQVDYKIRMQTD